MLADRDKLNELGLRRFAKDFDNVESQYLNLIYDPVHNRVVEKWVYEKTIGMSGFGASGKGEVLFKHFGFSVENVVKVAKGVLA